MSEENKPTEKQLLLAEHKKANDALKYLKDLVNNSEVYDKNVINVSYAFNTLSSYLRIQFERIMKSNTKRQISMKPIKVKNMEKDMASKKKVTKKPVAKKPMKKTVTKKMK